MPVLLALFAASALQAPPPIDVRAPLAADSLPQGGNNPAVARYKHRPEQLAVSGVVTDAQGQPVAGARLFVCGFQRQNNPFPKVPSLELGRGTTDRNGAFSLESRTMADARHQLCVIAPGRGTKFVDIDPDAKTLDVGKVTLPAEQKVRGKVVGPDGKPAGGVTIEVRCLISEASGIDWFGSPRPGEVLRPLTATTADDGTFELRGVPAGAASLWVRIDDERFALYERSTFVQAIRHTEGIIDLKGGADKPVVIKLSAPIYVSGVVTRKDTGAPLSKAWVGLTFAEIELAADSQTEAIWVQTDEQGRYRVRCGPWAERVHVYAFAPPGTPCPDWSAGPVEVPKGKLEVSLPVVMPVGILVRGKIVEAGTGEPVANASYVHILNREKPKTMSRDDAHLMYWSNEYHYRYSGADGSFEQPLPAGESGVILVKAPDSTYVMQITSFGEIMAGKPGPWWSMVEGVAKVATKRDAKGLTLDIPLTRGVTASGTVAGPNGAVVRRGVVFKATPLHTHSYQLHEEAWDHQVRDGQFSVGACDPSAPTELYFFDPEHQWGATARFDPAAQDGKPLHVVLEPCGSARVRFVDSGKKPVVGADGLMAAQFLTALTLGFRKTDWERQQPFPQDFYYGRRAYQLDPGRYEKLAPDKDGVVVYPSLIPGAPYKWVTADPKGVFAGPPTSRSVRVRPGETTDLGDVTIAPPDPPK